ncbi:MFS transporter [Leucobacter chinensis]|uniref:MFS transporter n=1 Tax=Leucobacter chinensis TaxID=2851010 RepID=UPI001C212B49|nr:MFS transporter [Leucobacter chinensis]
MTTLPMSTSEDDTPVKKRVVFAWSLWDWGSAAFNAVVTTFVFATYLVSGAFGDESVVSPKLGFALTIAGIVIALVAPIAGRISDSGGHRRRWLGVNSAIVAVCIALLVFVAPEERYLTFALIVLAVGNVAFEFASVSYNSMLTQVSTNANVGKVSGFGWGMGYIGGIVLLGILLVGFIFPDEGWFGVTADNAWNIRIAMLFSAVWFGVFALPVLFAVPEIDATPNRERATVVSAYRDLFRTISNLWKTARQTLFYLFASAVFRDGLAGVFAFGGVIAAASFGFSADTVIIFAIAANVVAGLATILCGALEDRLGAKNIMVGSLVSMVLFGLLVFMLADFGTWVFWVFGLLLCVFVGPVQSSSRTYLAKLIPKGREGEIFGLYATTGRAVSFLSPAAFSVAVVIGGSTIYGILGIVFVVLVGLLLLLPVQATAIEARDE